ncbi:MAG: hypothetical protein KC635_06150 [Myxococcales bacterium]|nr:hypothetical protein [Myxococcales bacterium]MCB9732186.1 hypothetical protein [Deltaproteobacteria bacterium]
MRMLSFHGSPRDMGRAFGESCRDEIRTFFELRVKNAVGQALEYGGRHVSADDVVRVARACLAPTEAYDPRGYDELLGIAEGADMPIEHVLATNGLTDIRDVLSWGGDLEAFGGCTAFLAQRDVTRDGRVLVGQTWDLATDNLPYVLAVHRRPDDAPETWCLTTVGCLSLIGMNDAGVAVGTTNVRTTDARPGATYLSLIHKALGQRDLEGAIGAIVDAPRAGAHFYYVADAHGGAVAVECSARRAWRHDVEGGFFGHTNHCLIEDNVAIQGSEVRASSEARLMRLDALFAEHRGRFDLDVAQAVLSDRENGQNAIRRDDFNGINTNGAVVMSPEDGVILACHGLPDAGPWSDLKALAANADS